MMIEIDGSQGEGGGQVLRSALTLSVLTGQPFRIAGIRAGRRKPGLLRQHLTAVQAVASVCSARVTGDQPGSQELTFHPGKLRSGSFQFAVGTAGSAVLVLQTLIPLWLTGHQSAEICVEGGTHNSMAPPYDHLERCWMPVLHRLGAQLELELQRPGFYPAGGGRIRAVVSGSRSLKGWTWNDRGAGTGRDLRILLAHIPDSIGFRQTKALLDRLGWSSENVRVQRCDDSVGPGNAIVATLLFEHACEVVTGFGAKGVPTGHVVDQVVAGVRGYLKSTAPVGEHLADQLMIPFALTEQGAYRAVGASLHTTTQAALVNTFLPGRIRIVRDTHDGTWVERA